MSVERVTDRSGGPVWRTRWREDGCNRARTFSTAKDARDFDAKVRQLRRGRALDQLDAGQEPLDEFVVQTWTPTYAVDLAEKTKRHYASLYDHHLSPYLGDVPLRDLTPERIARWQADRLKAGAGRVAVRHSIELLGTILQRAYEGRRIPSNPCRLVRKVSKPRRQEVRPLAPSTVEAMRAAMAPRDATLVAVLAYAGLRPGEALALRWGDVRDRTLLVERALSLGAEKGTKTEQARTVRLLSPLKSDLAAWRMLGGRPDDDALLFPGVDGRPWTEAAYASWRRMASGKPKYKTGKPGRGAGPFARALDAAGIDHARPYDLRHSFASLLLHEGRSVIYVARQLGHDARLTLTTYGHVIDELEEAPRVDAEATIKAAREGLVPAEYPRAETVEG